MLSTYLKEAQQIVDGIAWLDKALSMKRPEDCGQTQSENASIQLLGNKIQGYSNNYERTSYQLSAEARVAAHKVLIAEWTARRAQLVRRANQIGLVLKTKQ